MTLMPLSLVWEIEHFAFADAYAEALGISRAQASRMLMDVLMQNPPSLLQLIEASQKRHAAAKS